MGGLDAMNETFGGDISSDLAIVIAFFVLVALVIGFLHMLAATWKQPAMWPIVIGTFAFWPLAQTNRPVAAMGVLLAAMMLTFALQHLQERRRARGSRDGRSK